MLHSGTKMWYTDYIPACKSREEASCDLAGNGYTVNDGWVAED